MMGHGIPKAGNERDREIEVVARALAGDDQGPWYAYEEDAEKAIAALDALRASQNGDHEAAEIAAAKALYPILHAVSRGEGPEALLGHAVRVTLDAYLARLSSAARDRLTPNARAT